MPAEYAISRFSVASLSKLKELKLEATLLRTSGQTYPLVLRVASMGETDTKWNTLNL